MGEVTQEPDFEVPNQEEDDRKLQESINLSLLRLESFKNIHQNFHPCTTCACNVTAFNPMKRPSPEPIPETKSKKASLDNHQYSLSGFSKLPLPQLHRSASDPYTPPKANLSENAKALEDTPLSKVFLKRMKNMMTVRARVVHTINLNNSDLKRFLPTLQIDELLYFFCLNCLNVDHPFTKIIIVKCPAIYRQKIPP